MTGWLAPLILAHGVPLVALLVFAGELGVPTGIPAELALLLAGAYAVHSMPGLISGLLLVGVADLLGTTSLHLIARTGGVRLLRRVRPERAAGHAPALGAWRARLGRHDLLVVFIIRLLPLVRMSAAIATGLLRVRLRSFVLGAAPAALLWAGTPLSLGYLFRADIVAIAHRYASASHLMLLTVPAIGLLTATGGWMLGASSAETRLRRMRVGLGLAAILTGTVAGVRAGWDIASGLVVAHGVLPGARVAVLGGLTLALAAVILADLRPASAPDDGRTRRRWVSDVTISLLWAALIGAVGAMVWLIGMHDTVL